MSHPQSKTVSWPNAVSGLCAGTRVLLSNGLYKSIEDVKAGDRVINQYGQPVNVVSAQVLNSSRPIHRSRHVVFGTATTTCEECYHLVGDLNSVSQVSLSSSGYAGIFRRPFIMEDEHGQLNSYDRKVWKQARHMERDIFLSPEVISFEGPSDLSIDVSKWAIDPKRLLRHHASQSYSLGYMLGTFVGDGNSRVEKGVVYGAEQGYVAWTFGANEMDIAEKCALHVKKVTGRDALIQPHHTKAIIKVLLYSLPWARILHTFGKKTAKHLPEEYLCTDPRYLDGLLDGLVDSDGYIGADGRICFTNTSPQLMELFSMLCKRIHGSFPNTSRPNRKVGGLQNANLANFNDAWSSRLNKSHLVRNIHGYQLIKQASFDTMTTEEFSDDAKLYGIEVDCDTHSFVANNVIVHDCTPCIPKYSPAKRVKRPR